MHIVNVFLYCCVFLCVSGKSLEKWRGYHEMVGIPKAAAIRQAEMSRIVGGRPVTSLTEHPHQAGIVAVLTNGQTSICGGSLVSNTRVLTAAHCWWDGVSQAREFTVVLGSLTIFNGGTRISTRNIVVHANWNFNTVINDIAMVIITQVTFSNTIQAIALPVAADATQDFSGLTGTISGYGKNSDTQTTFPTTTTLHHTNVGVITNRVCQNSFELTIHNTWMCTNGRGGLGTCDGDSGGPLTVMWKNKRTQVGVVSFGLGDYCQTSLPSVYTRVTSFLSWINANL